MKHLTKKLEIVANIGIVVVAVAIVVLMVQRYLLPTTPKAPPEAPKVGTKISIADYDWNGQPKTLVLALETRCRFCTESAPFYKRLVEKAQQQNVKVIAFLPQTRQESEDYLNKLGITGLEVKQGKLESIKVGATPTLLIVNSKGEVSNAWLGKLAPDKEMEVMNQL